MTKARTRGGKRRSRNITLAGDAPPVTAAPLGGPRRKEPPANAVVLAARVRMTGCAPDAAHDPAYGHDMMGAAIMATIGDTKRAEAAHSLWREITAAWHNYATRDLGKSPSPQSIGMTMTADHTEVDPSLRIDLRTADEKVAAARRAWQHHLGQIEAIPERQARLALRGFAQGILSEPWNPRLRVATISGMAAVRGLVAVMKNDGGGKNSAGRKKGVY